MKFLGMQKLLVNVGIKLRSNQVSFKDLKKKWKLEQQIPDWYSTNSLQFFMNKYSYKGESVRSRDTAIAKYLADNCPDVYPDWWGTDTYTQGLSYQDVFFNAIYRDGYAIPSTPLKANAGVPERGMTVSCSRQYVENNIASKYLNNAETAIFTKLSHGCSVTVDDWLAEGDSIGEGDFSEGVVPIIDMIKKTTLEITHSTRRGQVAFYVGIDHGDFWKIAQMLYEDPDGLNIGWLVPDSFIQKLTNKEQDAVARWNRMLYVRLAKGKGYLAMTDRMNRNKAQTFKNLGLHIKGSNLCNELNLPANADYSSTCVIINANLALYDEFPKHLFHILHLMQDANVSGYLKQIDAQKSHSRNLLSKAYNFTKDFRAVGTGSAGLHSLFMKKRIVFGSFESMVLNEEIFKRMQHDTNEMNVWLADVLGVPDGVRKAGLHLRNATTMFSPPTKSCAELARDTPTEGNNLETALIKVKESAGGEIFRINYEFLKFMKEKGMYNKDEVARIAKNKGSVQDCDWMTEDEKAVFRIAFEIPMSAHIELCSQRQQYFDQQQSINLYFSGSDTEEYIGQIHKQALLDEGINSLYYCYSSRGGRYTRVTSCEVCE